MHYSIIIQGEAPNGYFTWQQGSYMFKNPYITMMKVLFTPDETTTAAFNNVDTKNIVTNGKGEKVEFEKGFYTLAEILAMLNEMTNCGFSVITSTNSFGCVFVTSSTTIDLSNAPDIREILGITETSLTSGQTIGKNIIDITRNRQVIQVFCSIVRTSDLKIADQNNNLLTTMMIDDPQSNYFRKIEDVCIPICNQFDRLYFSFKDLDGNLVNLTGVFELQLTIDDEVAYGNSATSLDVATYGNAGTKGSLAESNKSESKDSVSSFSQFSLSQVCNTPKTVVKLENPLSFKQCYISSISLYTDFKLFNVSSDQIVKVYGEKTSSELTAEIEIPRGQYTIEELLALLNCGDSLFELIYYGEKAFRITISNFNFIDFRQAQDIKTILGITSLVITESDGQEIRFPLTSECNKISVTNKVKNQTKTFEVTTGSYTWSEFVNMLIITLEEFVGTISIKEYDDYIDFQARDEFYFNRTNTETLNTIQNYYWLKWYTLTPNIQSNLLEKPDLNILDPSFKANDAFWVEKDLCLCLYPNISLTKDYEFYWNTNVTVSFSGLEQKTFSYNENAASLQDFCEAFTTWCDSNFTGLVTLSYDASSGNPIFTSPNTTFTLTFPNSFPVSSTKVVENNICSITLNMSTTNIKDLYITSHDFLDDVVLDITVQNKKSVSSRIETTLTIPAGHYSSQEFVTLIVNFINENAKKVGISNPDLFCWKGIGYRWCVYGGSGFSWTLVPQHKNDFYIIESNTGTYYAYDKQHLPRYCIRLNSDMKPMRRWDKDITVPSGIVNNVSTTYTVMQGNGFYNKILRGLCNGSRSFNSKASFIPFSYWDNRFLFSGNTKYSCIFTQYGNEIDISIKDKIISTFNSPFGTRSYIVLQDNKWKTGWGSTTFKYSVANSSNSTTITIPSSSGTQPQFIQVMNQLFETNNLNIQWTVAEDGYKLLTLGGIFSGTFFNLKVLGIPNIEVKANYILWPYTFSQSTQTCHVGRGYFMSDSPCDITNNLSNLKLYCNIVKSKTKPLLSNIPIDDLNKNYFYKNRLLIPCLEFLDRLEYEFRDENDEELSFLGNIYLLLSFTTQS